MNLLVIIPAKEIAAGDRVLIDFAPATVESVFNTGHGRVQLGVKAPSFTDEAKGWVNEDDLVGVFRRFA